MQYLRLMSNKLCACIILAVWTVLIISSTGLFIFLFNKFNETHSFSMVDIVTDQVFLTTTAVLANVFFVPCFVLIAAFAIALVCIARNQARKIKAETINLGKIATKEDTSKNQQAERPKNLRSRKPVWSLFLYITTVILTWVPSLIVGNLVLFQILKLEQIWVPLLVVSGFSLLQMVLGALYLTYAQKEHRLVLRNTCRVITNKLKC